MKCYTTHVGLAKGMIPSWPASPSSWAERGGERISLGEKHCWSASTHTTGTSRECLGGDLHAPPGGWKHHKDGVRHPQRIVSLQTMAVATPLRLITAQGRL